MTMKVPKKPKDPEEVKRKWRERARMAEELCKSSEPGFLLRHCKWLWAVVMIPRLFLDAIWHAILRRWRKP